MGKYTPYNSIYIDTLIDSHMKRIIEEVLNAVPHDYIKAIILGGGYGRGEGGILHEAENELLFNDYDLFVIAPNISRKKLQLVNYKLTQVHKKLTKEFGIDVDFGPCKTVNFLKKAPFWLVYYELKYGHKIIYGDEGVLNYLPTWDGSEIDLEEGLKLLLNRGVALVQSRQSLLHFNDESIEYVSRNNNKAVMAMCDAILMSEHLYHYSYLKRKELIESVCEPKNVALLKETNLITLYRDAIDFKMSPNYKYVTGEELWVWTSKLIDIFQKVYYHLFQTYSAKKGNYSMNEYQDSLKYDLFFEKGKIILLKNIFYWLRVKPFHLCALRDVVRHPRVLLYRDLPSLLFVDRLYDFNKIDKKLITEWEIKVDSFLTIWSTFN